jgi:hypothetical protein
LRSLVGPAEHTGGHSHDKRRNRTRSAATVSTSDATEFLIKYKEAWETRNADLAVGLFTRDAEYRQDPFGSAIVGREAADAGQRPFGDPFADSRLFLLAPDVDLR